MEPTVVTGAQVQEARRLLGWSSYRLAARCSVSASVIRTFEMTGRVLQAAPTIVRDAAAIDRAAMIRAALEDAGIEFMDPSDGRPMVRIRADA